MRSTRGAAVFGLLAWLAIVAGCRSIAGYALAGRGEAGFDRSADTSTWKDVGALHDGVGDVGARKDVGLPRTLTCDAPSLVGTKQVPGLREPAITPDGLELHARVGAKTYVTRREDMSSPFGDWTQTTLWPANPSKQDPAFFKADDGKLWAMTSFVPSGGTNGLRRLHRCPLDSSACEQVTVYDAKGQPLALDLDGPSLTESLQMLISVASSGPEAAIYEAVGRAGGQIVWDARPLLLSLDGMVLDDASITRDGGLIVVYDKASTPNRLYYTFRTTGGPTPLQPIAVGPSDPSSPEVFARPEGTYEIFFDDATTNGLQVIACWRAAK